MDLLLTILVSFLSLFLLFEILYVWKLKSRVEKLEEILSGLGPGAYKRLEEVSTKVSIGDRWIEDTE